MNIPIVDLNLMDGSLIQRRKFAKEIGSAFEEFGFVAIENHLLSQEIQSVLYETWANFFDLNLDEKLKYAKPDLFFQRGYTPKKSEQAVGFSLADEKEFYHIGQPDEVAIKVGCEFNVWPNEIPGLKEVNLRAFALLEETGLKVMRGIALHLGLNEDYFDEKLKGGNSILRPIHYYPLIEGEFEEGAVRAGAHTDINFITLLMGASAAGLEILKKDGDWLPVTAYGDHLICNVSDMLQRLTNGVLVSTEHRVVNGENSTQSRFSIPFFMHAKGDVSLRSLDSCVTDSNPRQYSDLTAGEYLQDRLSKIIKR